MVVGEMPEGLDFLVIGGGPGGYTAALEAAARGRSVTLVDRAGADGIGGTCLLEGCIPSKALIEVADLRHRSLDFAGGALGFDSAVPPDLTRFQEWKNGMVARLSSGVRSRLTKAGVTIVAGSFTFTGPQRGVIELDGDAPPQHVEFEGAVIAVGSTVTQIPPLPFDGETVFDAAGILDVSELPERLVVVGGGYIGMEIGTAHRKLGSDVTVVEAAETILPEMPQAAQKHVARRASKLGIEVLTGHTAQGRDADGIVIADDSGATRTLPADAVLVAVGRRPATRDLGLAAVGITADPAGLIPVGPDGLAAPGIAAVGDVVAGPALAHKAIAEARVAVDALCGRPAAMVSTAIPLVVFSDPEVAVVGVTESAAQQEGMSVSVLRMPIGASGRAATMGSTDGVAEIVVDVDTDAVVGGVLVGPHASELIGELTLAVEMAAAPADLALTIHPHPTLSEMLQDTAGLASDPTI
ncbi:dihydrolipoyl dehydrogenase family protein [Brevibacterium jeotgali]|uniref:Dihydrolipoamide dehydrogenase n=1 Tax=Brevibacterium jeotgali TaxID=1262550 RepID=A0A2H1L9C5_9MICO|nr:FAD-dependent oxidoreductase [Brevibacterium jeotgali]TWC01624.1 dihydrolipoamide dehydrogenase [Brevibacterium jeotgali]SMY13063.1 dihydrolipoamide dehydrogenase [Brevibacterium jeotgali]